MLHLLPTGASEPPPQAYAEAVSRLASVRYALRLVDGFGGGPASDLGDEAEIASAWEGAGDGQRRAFERKSARLVGTTAAGIEALLSERNKGREPNVEANRELVDQIRRELTEVARVILD